MKACAPILVNWCAAERPPSDRPVADIDVAAERRAIREDDLVAEAAVVRDVRIGHEEIVVADAGHARAGDVPRLTVHGFAEHVAVADLEPSGLALVFLVLRRTRRSRRTERSCCSRPMRVGPLITTCGPIQVRAPISTSRPMTLKGPSSTSAASCACGRDDRARIDHPAFSALRRVGGLGPGRLGLGRNHDLGRADLRAVHLARGSRTSRFP